MNKLKLLFLSALVLLVAAACNNQNNNSQGNQSGTQNSQPQTQTFRYQPDGFELQYPADLSFAAPQYADLEQKIMQLNLPTGDYKNTNFIDAGIAASSQPATALNSCLNLPATALELQTKFNASNTAMINGQTFYTAQGNGAAAGNLYETRAYRIWKNNSCIELTETLHTGNIGNYPQGTVTEVDHAAVFNRLDQILNTFKFSGV